MPVFISVFMAVALVFLRVCMDCCTSVSQCLYALLRLCFSVFV